MNYKECGGFVMTASSNNSELYFSELGGWIRALGAPSLAMLNRKAERANHKGVPYEALVYGLENSKSTPDEEWQNLVKSTWRAREIGDQYDKKLIMAPGFRLMTNNPDSYSDMAAIADIWILQTQRLQVNPPGQIYREEVKRVVDEIRRGNPNIKIWAQITLPPDREPNAEEWLAYHRSIADLVDGTYIGVYTWGSEDSDVLVRTIQAIFDAVCGDVQ